MAMWLFSGDARGAQPAPYSETVRIAVKPHAGKHADVDAQHSKHSAGDVKRSKKLGWQFVTVTGDIDAIVADYKTVATAEREVIYSVDVEPNDPQYPQLWGMKKIAAPSAWDTKTDASSIIVVVLDTGTDTAHPDLAANIWVGPNGENGYVCTNGVACQPNQVDGFGHGTHVAGTIGAVGNNLVGVVGVNWRVKILPMRFLNPSGSSIDAALAYEKIIQLREAGQNIRVVNNSWGGGGYSQLVRDAMEQAAALGIVTVCAAGNNGRNVDGTPHYPSSYPFPSMLAVQSSMTNDAASSFSNYGLALTDLAAPGSGILSTCRGGLYCTMNGTSMATPHVSGALALMFAVYPTLTAQQAHDAILHPDCVDRLADPKLSLSTSFGGRLNLAKLLANAGRIGAAPANRLPVLTASVPQVGGPGQVVTATGSCTDIDGDPVRTHSSQASPMNQMEVVLQQVTGNVNPITVPSLARTAVARFAVSCADGRGGSATAADGAAVVLKPDPNNSGAIAEPVLTLVQSNGSVYARVTLLNDLGDRWWWTLTQGSSVSGTIGANNTYVTSNLQGCDTYHATIINEHLAMRDSADVKICSPNWTGSGPTARVTVSPNQCIAPCVVTVTTTATDADGTIASYDLIKPDGSRVGFVTNPTTLTISTPGMHRIGMLARDNNGWLARDDDYVTVVPATMTEPPPPPPPQFVCGDLTCNGNETCMTCPQDCGNCPPPIDHPPTAPSNLTGRRTNKNFIALSWQASADDNGVASYRIYRDGAQVGSTSVTSYQYRAKSDGRDHVFKVQAVDTANQVSLFSNEVSVR